MEFSFTDIIQVVKDAINTIFKGQIPSTLGYIIAWIIICLAFLFTLYVSLYLIKNIIILVKSDVLPIFYSSTDRARRIRRQRFAEHIEYEIRRLNNLEAWSHYKFTELEAEVQAEGLRLSWLPFFSNRDKIRHESSLSKALARSTERLILLEGDPGAGKSIALRQITLRLSQRASRARNLRAVIPIYINLRGLERTSQPIDSKLIKDFVLASLNRANSRDIEEFLEDEFDQGLQNDTWLFFFDSFDEIPDILSSTEADEVITQYAEGISDFLHGMNKCRGIVASREYRGPRQLGWPKFRILPLSEKRQIELVQKSDLKGEETSKAIGHLLASPFSIRTMATNPMFLGLLCEYIKKTNKFPSNTHVVYEEYIQNRLARDSERLERRYGFDISTIRTAAEKIAFTMAAEQAIGLSPKRSELAVAMVCQNLELGEQYEIILDALEYLKLARAETDPSLRTNRAFTFAHRRFQEYFATSVILHEPDRVSSKELLTNGQWRETAVVLLQTQPVEKLQPLLNYAEYLLEAFVEDINRELNQAEANTDPSEPVSTEQHTILLKPLLWPKGLLHSLGLLQDGLNDRQTDIPPSISDLIGNLTNIIWKNGTWLDKKWILELAGTAPQATLIQILKGAFLHHSKLVRDAAYRQAPKLNDLSKEIKHAIRDALCDMALSGRLNRDKHTVRTHLLQLREYDYFLKLLWWLQSIQPIDTLFTLAGLTILWWSITLQTDVRSVYVSIIQVWLSLSFAVPAILSWYYHLGKMSHGIRVIIANFYLLLIFMAVVIVFIIGISSLYKRIFLTDILTPVAYSEAVKIELPTFLDGLFDKMGQSAILVLKPFFLPFLFYSYLVTWLLSVYYYVKLGLPISRALWFISLILHPIFGGIVLYHKLLINRKIILSACLRISGIILILVLFDWVFVYLSSIYVTYVFILSLIFIGSVMVSVLVKYVRAMILDLLTEISDNAKSFANPGPLWEEAQRYRTVLFRNRFMQRRRAVGIHIYLPQLSLLEQMAIQAEEDLARESNPENSTTVYKKTLEENAFTQWYSQFCSNKHSTGLAKWGSEFLDELYLIIQDLKLAQRGSQSSDMPN